MGKGGQPAAETVAWDGGRGTEVLGAVQPQAEVRRRTNRGEPRERLPSALSSGLGGLSVGVTGSEAGAMGSVAFSPFQACSLSVGTRNREVEDARGKSPSSGCGGDHPLLLLNTCHQTWPLSCRVRGVLSKRSRDRPRVSMKLRARA